MLIKRADVDINQYNRLGNSALHEAVTSCREANVVFLLEHGLSIGPMSDHRYDFVVFCARRYGAGSSAAKMLRVANIDVNERCFGNDTYLHVAAHRGHRDVIIFLLWMEADVFAAGSYGSIAYHVHHTSPRFEYMDSLMEICTRNAAVLRRIREISVAFAPMRLHPYVLLKIVDFLDVCVCLCKWCTFKMADVPEKLKVDVLVGVQARTNRVFDKRAKIETCV